MKSRILSIIAAGTVAIGMLTSSPAEEAKEVTITADKIQLLYDVKEFSVKAGEKVKLKLVVPAGCPFPHNLIIVPPGKKDALAAAATTAMTTDTNYLTTSQCLPEFEGIIAHTNLVAGGAEEVIEFEAPSEAGEYPYVCTYPGHWITMVGVMKVE